MAALCQPWLAVGAAPLETNADASISRQTVSVESEPDDDGESEQHGRDRSITQVQAAWRGKQARNQLMAEWDSGESEFDRLKREKEEERLREKEKMDREREREQEEIKLKLENEQRQRDSLRAAMPPPSSLVSSSLLIVGTGLVPVDVLALSKFCVQDVLASHRVARQKPTTRMFPPHLIRGRAGQIVALRNKKRAKVRSPSLGLDR